MNNEAAREVIESFGNGLGLEVKIERVNDAWAVDVGGFCFKSASKAKLETVIHCVVSDILRGSVWKLLPQRGSGGALS